MQMAITQFTIQGKNPLRGAVSAGGSRQAALWMIAACLLTTEKVTLTNVPHVHDIELMLESLRGLGAAAGWTAAHEVTIHASELTTIVLPSHLPISSTASALFFGALLVRSGQASLESAGQSALLHPFFLYQLEQFGAYVETDSQKYRAEAERLRSTHITFPEHTVAGTVQAIFLASLAVGQTIIEQAASEPEVDDLLAFLQRMGCQCRRADEQIIIVDGVTTLHGATYEVMPDRLNAVFFSVAALLSEGDVLVKGVKQSDILSYLAKLQQLGVTYTVVPDGIRFWSQRGQLYRPITIEARPYPGIASAWLPIFFPLLARVDGVSTVHYISETDRQVLETLGTFGLEYHIQGDEATIFGPSALSGKSVEIHHATEAMAVSLAALGSVGATTISGVEVLDHVLEYTDERLGSLGARLTRHEV
jgi:UDP-N-acetylglucosamine 1-carboxyvinyltransferase